MVTKRIIPCLDIRNGRVVKGVNFKGVQDVEDPVALARRYNDAGADELVFYDITASVEGRGLFTDVLRDVARQIFIPLTVGGAINTLEDFDRVLKCGADKVSVNSGAIRNPGIIPAAPSKTRPSSERLRRNTATSVWCSPWTWPAWTANTTCSQKAGARIPVWTHWNGLCAAKPGARGRSC